MLGLFVSVEVDGAERNELFSGFAIIHKEFLWWLTAGHVVDAIEEILNNRDIAVRNVNWVDNCTIESAEVLPVSDRAFPRLSASRFGIDLGISIIGGLDKAALLKGNQNLFLTEAVWGGRENARPEGYYLIGFPNERMSENGKFAEIACLPIERVPYEVAAREEPLFATDSKAFYGRIVDFSTHSNYTLKNIAGMSGGPIFSVERRGNQTVYYLFAIQSSWQKRCQMLKAVDIDQFVSDFLVATK